MRRPLVFGVAAAVITAVAAGCTFLISFDEVPVDASAAVEAGPTKDVEVDTPVVDAEAPDTSSAPFPPECDPTFPLTKVNCNGATRPNCAKRTTLFTSYPAGYDRTNDLVLCNGNVNPTCVRHCPYGCAEMPLGFEDHCDDCNGRENGYYCGRDLRGWDPGGNDLAVACDGGVAERGAICGLNNCVTPCTRAGGPTPSCCK